MKKTLSLLLTIALVFVMMPSTAFAANPLKASGEYTLKVVNDSDAAGKYEVKINDETQQVLVAANGEWETQLSEGDEYSVKLIDRPDYFKVSSAYGTFESGDASFAFDDEWTGNALTTFKKTLEDQFVTFLRDKDGNKLIKRSEYTGDNKLTSQDKDTFVMIDSADRDKVLDCKTCSSNSSSDLPSSWKDYKSGKHFFLQDSLIRWTVSKPDNTGLLFTPTTFTFDATGKATFTTGTAESLAFATEWPTGFNPTSQNALLKSTNEQFIANKKTALGDEMAKTLFVNEVTTFLGAIAGKSVFKYQPVDKADVEVDAEAGKDITLTFTAKATKQKSKGFSFKLLNEERFDAVTKTLSKELVSDLIQDRKFLEDVDTDSIDSIAALLQKTYIEMAGTLASKDAMPLNSKIQLKEVDLKDGFYEGLQYQLDLQNQVMLSLDPGLLLDSATDGALKSVDKLLDTLNGIIVIAKLVNADTEEMERVSYIIDKDIPKDSLVLPISIGGLYSSAGEVREGIYELSLSAPGAGWLLPEKKVYVKINADGTYKQVNLDGSAVTNSVFQTKKGIELDVKGIVSQLMEGSSLGDTIDALLKLFKDNAAFANQETGIWVGHKAPTVEFDTADFGEALAGAEYILVNKKQLTDLVDALLKIGKEEVNAVEGGIGYSGLKDIKKIVSGVKSGDISTEQIEKILITALQNSDDLEGINIPTILEAVADENGVVRFDENSEVTIGKISSTVPAAYDAVIEEAGIISKALDGLKKKVDSVSEKIKGIKDKVDATIGKITGIFKKSSKKENAVDENKLKTAPLQARLLGAESLIPQEYADMLRKAGDEETVNAFIGFVDWINGILNPRMKIGSQSGTIHQGTAGKATFALSGSDFNPETFTFKWSDKKAPAGLSASISGKILTINATAEAVQGEYDFKVSGTYDGLTLSAEGTVKVSGQAAAHSISIGGQSNQIFQGEGGTARFTLSTKGLNGPSFTFEWSANEAPVGITGGIEGSNVVLNVSDSVKAGTYEFRVVANDGENTVSAKRSLTVSEKGLTDVEKIMGIISNLGNKSIGVTALNLLGLKDGTLPEGNYLMIQIKAPEGVRPIKGAYKVNVVWNETLENYDIQISEGTMVKLSRKYNKFADATAKLKDRLETIGSFAELGFLIFNNFTYR